MRSISMSIEHNNSTIEPGSVLSNQIKRLHEIQDLYFDTEDSVRTELDAELETLCRELATQGYGIDDLCRDTPEIT